MGTHKTFDLVVKRKYKGLTEEQYLESIELIKQSRDKGADIKWNVKVNHATTFDIGDLVVYKFAAQNSRLPTIWRVFALDQFGDIVLEKVSNASKSRAVRREVNPQDALRHATIQELLRHRGLTVTFESQRCKTPVFTPSIGLSGTSFTPGVSDPHDFAS